MLVSKLVDGHGGKSPRHPENASSSLDAPGDAHDDLNPPLDSLVPPGGSGESVAVPLDGIPDRHPTVDEPNGARWKDRCTAGNAIGEVVETGCKRNRDAGLAVMTSEDTEGTEKTENTESKRESKTGGDEGNGENEGHGKVQIVAVDLQEMAPIEGVMQLQASQSIPLYSVRSTLLQQT